QQVTASRSDVLVVECDKAEKSFAIPYVADLRPADGDTRRTRQMFLRARETEGGFSCRVSNGDTATRMICKPRTRLYRRVRTRLVVDATRMARLKTTAVSRREMAQDQ
ncbi:hypothetical protein, partial [Candidatus Burkholderia verschuerenii]|uniref:hypothetical protein n=1 Tax=Candidatus Burkholderia verschuerenii TaxID=242163 RepID=UPI001E639684